MFLFVAEQASPVGGRIGGPHAGCCALCGLWLDPSSVESQMISFTYHMGRAHPWEYLERTGEMPSDAHLQQQEYLIREGFGGT